MASVDLAAVHSILTATPTFRDRSIRVASISNRHAEQKCFRVEADYTLPAYKIRFATRTNKLSVATEHEAFRTLRLHGVAWAPHIYEFHADDPPYLVVDYEEGESLDQSLHWITYANLIVNGLSRLLLDIHEINGDYFGRLAGPRYSSWQAFVDVRFWYHVSPLVSAGIISKADLRRIRLLYDEASEAFRNVSPRLLHADVKPGNIVFDSARVKTALVDFELARFGDIDFEWCKLYRLGLRWPEYGRTIVEPLLTEFAPIQEHSAAQEAKKLLYALYVACSFLDYDRDAGLPIPSYRMSDLTEVLDAVRVRIA